MNSKKIMKAIGSIDDQKVAKFANLTCDACKKKNNKEDNLMKRIGVWLSAAAAVLILGVGIFGIRHIIIEHGISSHVHVPEEQASEDPTMLGFALNELYKNARMEPDTDRIVFDNGLESWRTFYDEHNISYAAVKGEVISTKYYGYWLNDENSPTISWGAEVSEVRLENIPTELNKLGLQAGATVYVLDSVKMIPADGDFFKLMSSKTGRSIENIEDLTDVDSFRFEITANDFEHYSFTPYVKNNTLPKVMGESYFMLICTSESVQSQLSDIYDSIYYCAVSVPTNGEYGYIHDKLGFQFDLDIIRIAEEMVAYFS